MSDARPDQPDPLRIEHVAIVGAGFSGTLQAINLLRHDGPRVTLIERRGAFGRGVAYSTPNPDHLLNVRAANMSALPDDPDHFARWLAQRGKGEPSSFALRSDYGAYLADLIDEHGRRNPRRLTLRHDDAGELTLRPDGVSIALTGGDVVDADAAVLALGNLPPHDPPGLAAANLPADLYAGDPWRDAVTAGLTDEDVVLIVGTGLTMIDTVLTLASSGFGGRMVAMSRRGLKPRGHGDVTLPSERLTGRPRGTLSELVRTVRARARRFGWRAAIDELRPLTQAMWLAADPDEQRRFLRHLRAWWDVHRHRLAPPVADRIAVLEGSGRLQLIAGKIETARALDEAVEIGWRPRGGDASERMQVRRVVNCTGPQGDLLRTREPLLRLLLAAGHVRPDRHGFGIDVNPQAETIDAAGRANRCLLALGPLTRGTFWEIVAVPDIRIQTWSVARRLSNAHWVGGEGL